VREGSEWKKLAEVTAEDRPQGEEREREREKEREREEEE